MGVFRRKQVKVGPETAPRSLAIAPSRNSSTAVVISWWPPERTNGTLTEYAISHQDAGEGGKFTDVWEISRAPADAKSIILEGFRPDRTYNFRIQAKKGEVYGPMSSVVKFRRIDIKDIDMYEDAEVIPFDSERGSDDPTALPFKINLGLPEEHELPEPQFLRAPLDTKVPHDRAMVDASEEDI